jgi:protoheme IX farnesyltransferase
MNLTAERTLPVASVRDLISLAKPRITLMVLVTAAGGMWLAPGQRSGWVVAITLFTTAAVVAAANSLNCYLERDTDRLMRRTRNRPLPDRRMRPRVALLTGLGLGAFSVPALWLGVNPLTGALGALALASYVVVYTPMKQVSSSALLVGALPGALPPLMGWTAATGEIGAPGLVLFGILFLWQIPHSLAISIFRREEYEAAGLVVLPSVRGDHYARVQSAIYTLALFPVSLMLYPLGVAGPIYLVSALVLGVGFLALVLPGLRREAHPKWSRRVFVGSLVYLTALFVALVAGAASGI